MSDVNWNRLSKKQRRLIAQGREKQAKIEALRTPQPDCRIGPRLPVFNAKPKHKRPPKFKKGRKPAKKYRAGIWVVRTIPEKPNFSPRYLEYIKSRAWFRFRKRIFEERGRKCERCGTTKGIIQLHHKTYSRLGHELPEDVEVICRCCHENHHGRRFAEQNVDPVISGDLASNWMKTVEKREIC